MRAREGRGREEGREGGREKGVTCPHGWEPGSMGLRPAGLFLEAEEGCSRAVACLALSLPRNALWSMSCGWGA